MLLLAFWRLFIGCGRTEEVVARTITTFIDWKHVTSGEMDQLELNPRIIAAVSRAHLKSAREVLCVSGPDLQRLTGLSSSDVQQLLIAAATSCRHHPPTAGEFRPGLLIGRHRGHRGCPNEQSVSLSAAHELHCKFNAGLRLSVGCPVLNQLLRGGLLVGGVTELAGESGAGKTQLALQLCLSVQYPTQYGGLHSGAVYICTEDSFPIKRLQQLIRCQYLLRSDVPPALISSLQFSDRVYIEHVADLDSLQVCLSRRVPLLLTRGLVRLLVVDSFAALFRSEFQAADWLERSKQLLTFSSTLHHLSLRFTTPVLCINQVTDFLSGSDNSLGPLSSSVSPALGLLWANQVMVRLMMRRLQATVAYGDQSSVLRRLEVVFAPHLARSGRDAAVWREGVRGVMREGEEARGT
ncbi:DNA repair protein XRCC3 isoform 1-T1 [Spinachia spinachia]